MLILSHIDAIFLYNTNNFCTADCLILIVSAFIRRPVTFILTESIFGDFIYPGKCSVPHTGGVMVERTST